MKTLVMVIENVKLTLKRCVNEETKERYCLLCAPLCYNYFARISEVLMQESSS